MCVFFILSLSGCSDNPVYYYNKKHTNINIPIVQIDMTNLLDLQSVEKFDQKSLIPTKFTIGTDHQMVLNIQERLMSLGYMDDDKPTTIYSEDTALSVKKFQRQYGLTENGILTPDLYSLLMSKNAKTYEVKRSYEGDDIIMIQQRLYELSYIMEETDINGYFGEKTETAVKNLQLSNKIPPTGTIDLKTLNLLHSDNVIAYTIDKNAKESIIKKYQKRLQDLGYYLGDINGTYTESFKEAVRDYQYNNSQIADGWIGPSTKFSLDSKFAKPFSIHYGQKNATVKKIQKRLFELEYLKEGLITSAYGEFTAQCIAYFQKVHGLEMTGAVDGKTFKLLFSDEAMKSPRGFITQQSHFVMNTMDIRKLAEKEKDSGTCEDLIKVAELKIGSKNVWGAKGPNTFDCSGFVYWCLNQIGINTPYMTTYNWRYSTKFDRVENFDELTTGDLIIVSGHMGIVCDNQTVIDASSSNGKVVHRDLDDWWRKRFLVGFRIFNNNTKKIDE
ncbi:MAG: peptidoglycan-binding protein [Lachnospiraceae bacterium]|nr:peptidoglycan-binding protein [Lachnospiraceae bacterium]